MPNCGAFQTTNASSQNCSRLTAQNQNTNRCKHRQKSHKTRHFPKLQNQPQTGCSSVTTTRMGKKQTTCHQWTKQCNSTSGTFTRTERRCNASEFITFIRRRRLGKVTKSTWATRLIVFTRQTGVSNESQIHWMIECVNNFPSCIWCSLSFLMSKL